MPWSQHANPAALITNDGTDRQAAGRNCPYIGGSTHPLNSVSTSPATTDDEDEEVECDDHDRELEYDEDYADGLPLDSDELSEYLTTCGDTVGARLEFLEQDPVGNAMAIKEQLEVQDLIEHYHEDRVNAFNRDSSPLQDTPNASLTEVGMDRERSPSSRSPELLESDIRAKSCGVEYPVFYQGVAPEAVRNSYTVESFEGKIPNLDLFLRDNIQNWLSDIDFLDAALPNGGWSDGVLQRKRAEKRRLHQELFDMIETGRAYIEDAPRPEIASTEELVRQAEGWGPEAFVDIFADVFDSDPEDNASELDCHEVFWQKGAKTSGFDPARKFCASARKSHPIRCAEDAKIYSVLFDISKFQVARLHGIEAFLGRVDEALYFGGRIVPPRDAEELLRLQKGSLVLWSSLKYEADWLLLLADDRAKHFSEPAPLLSIECFREHWGTAAAIAQIEREKAQALRLKKSLERSQATSEVAIKVEPEDD
ncbi:hypothetical protein CKM354_000832400 [Cercospora kikuchii]|uniref:Uncharacterized protein n=1 Tax=Cercospora kikuchii TaxID=84275 RepID=A0A9P3CPH7_9PEZI|nr:uncharacterized protein CKM354_000832400 [Cercospora kikuchii]GIZ45142.1 hypothetical protein CKM354_000832400 [Cercospora kikuchii]